MDCAACASKINGTGPTLSAPARSVSGHVFICSWCENVVREAHTHKYI